MSNREIKFRAWLVDHEQMIFANNQASTDCDEIWVFSENNIKIQVQETIWREGGGETFERIEYVDTNAHIMQYTGLKDRNGVEIYEGDILRVGENLTAKIEYIGTNIDDYGDEINCAFHAVIMKHNKVIPLDFYLKKKCNVIGNIHQNPELL